MARQTVSFPNQRGEELAGILETPDQGSITACALFAHCFTCAKNLRAAANISKALTEHGIAVLRFDFTGLGESGGEFADTTFSSNVSDLVAAAGFLDSEYHAPGLLIGHSLGGTAVLMAAPEIAGSLAVVTIGAPADAAHVTRLLSHSREEIMARGQATVRIGGRPFRVRREFLEDLADQPVAARLATLDRALLVFHSPVDTVVSVDNAADIFQQARHPKSFITLDQADHLLSDRSDSRYVGQMVAAWARRYLPATELQGQPVSGDDSVTAVTGRRGFQTPIQAGPHRMVADEPAHVGGADQGPTPYGFLSAALASCTSMTLQMYARHKDLDLTTARVTVKHDKVHASDCEDCETRDGRIDRFDRSVALEGDLTDAQRRRLLEIADKCPVHRTFYGEVEIRTQLVA